MEMRTALERVSLHLENDTMNGFAWAAILGSNARWAVPVTTIYDDPTMEAWINREKALQAWWHMPSSDESNDIFLSRPPPEYIQTFDRFYWGQEANPLCPAPFLAIWTGAIVQPKYHVSLRSHEDENVIKRMVCTSEECYPVHLSTIDWLTGRPCWRW